MNEENNDRFYDLDGRRWSENPTFRATPRPYISEGLTSVCDNIINRKQCFKLFICEHISNKILSETNKKGAEIFGINQWITMDSIEFDAFLGLLVIFGALRIRKRAVDYIWNQNCAFRIPICSMTMSKNRFKQIMRALHFESRENILSEFHSQRNEANTENENVHFNNSTRSQNNENDERINGRAENEQDRFHFDERNVNVGNDNVSLQENQQPLEQQGQVNVVLKKDKLAPIRRVFELFNENLRKPYKPSPNLTIDEQLMGFRGRVPFRMYIRGKPDKTGIENHFLVDSVNGYLLRMMTYLGKLNGKKPEKNLAKKIIDYLTQYLTANYNITADNFFTSFETARELFKRKITFLGTLRQNKRCIAKFLKETRNRKVFSTKFAFFEEVTTLSYCRRPNKLVYLLSTLHHEPELLDNTIASEQAMSIYRGKDKSKLQNTSGEYVLRSTNNQKFEKIENDFISKKRERKSKLPVMIEMYNKTKGGVDLLDKLLKEYSCRRCVR
ncbi:piggyBac transposable element-derived protein 4-like protein, partial [Dinothrombium tinctorium]